MAEEKLDPRALFRPYAREAHRAFTPSRTDADAAKALVFLDTNVLLAPYKTSTTALTEIERIYTKLRKEKRLIVPAQVAREFARNRPNLVAALHKQIRDARSIGINGRYETPPVVHALPQHKAAQDAMMKMHAALKVLKESLDGLAETVADWKHTDPILDVYQRLFDAETVVELKQDAPTFEQIRKSRYEAKIPPGYKDKGKDDGGGGDLAIWLTVLQVAAERQLDALLITEDAKEDWYHRSPDGEAVLQRFELAHEFSEAVAGKAFRLMNLSQLLRDLGAADEVVEELRETEERDDVMSRGDAARGSIGLVCNALRAAKTPGYVLGIFANDDFDAVISRTEGPSEAIAVRFCPSLVAAQVLARDIRDVARVGSERGLAEVTMVFLLPSPTLAGEAGELFVIRIRRALRMVRKPVNVVVLTVGSGGMIPIINTSQHPVVKSAFAASRTTL